MGLRTNIFIICIVAFILTGCNNSESKDRVVGTFEKDKDTVKYVDAHKVGTWGEIVGDSQTQLPDDVESELYNQMGELIFTGDDLSKSYKVTSDGSIDYNGRKFVNLYNVINSVETKYDKNTLINFIIKKHKSSSNTIYVTVQIDNANGNDYEITLHDSMDGIKKYKELHDKYNEPIHWAITLTDKDTRDKLTLYGCKSYIIMPGTIEDVVVDMSEYDSTK